MTVVSKLKVFVLFRKGVILNLRVITVSIVDTEVNLTAFYDGCKHCRGSIDFTRKHVSEQKQMGVATDFRYIFSVVSFN